MHNVQSLELPNGNILSITSVAAAAGGRKWGRFRWLHVAESAGNFAGLNRKNVVEHFGSWEFDDRSQRQYRIALAKAMACFEKARAAAASELLAA